MLKADRGRVNGCMQAESIFAAVFIALGKGTGARWETGGRSMRSVASREARRDAVGGGGWDSMLEAK